VENDQMRGVVFDSKSGSFAVLARIVIDCTGDGDVAARAGAPYAKGRQGDGLLQPMTMMFRLGGLEWVQRDAHALRKLVDEAVRATGHHYRLPFERPWALHLPNPGEVTVQLTHVRGLDATDIRQRTWAEIEGRRQTQAVVSFLRQHVESFQDAYLIETATEIGVRETRRILGEYVLDEQDVREAQKFDDGIATVSFGIDIHNPDETAQTDIPLQGPYDIPYRCLVPRQIDNLLVAGRCISGTFEAHASYRVKGPCMAMGQAAGVAAALCTSRDEMPRTLGATLVREELLRQGVRLDATEMPDRRLAQDL